MYLNLQRYGSYKTNFLNYMNKILPLIYKLQAYHWKDRKTGIFLSRNEMLVLLYLAFSLDSLYAFPNPQVEDDWSSLSA